MHPDDGPLPLDLFALGRGFAYAATVALIGACAFAVLVPRWRHLDDHDGSLAARALSGAWRVAGGAAVLLLAAHLLRAWGQIQSFLDPGTPISRDVANAVLFQSTWGRGWMAQVAAALLALPVALTGSRRPAVGLAALGTAALLVAVSSPLTGHAMEHPWGRFPGVGLHALHLLGGGLWLGTLFSVLVAGLRSAQAGDAPAVARLVRAFSPVALTGAALAGAAGLLLSLVYVGDLGSLLGRTYGRVLLVKVVLLGGTAALGAWNWRKVTPRLGTPDATRALARSATAEIFVGLLLLAATAVLVALPAPRI